MLVHKMCVFFSTYKAGLRLLKTWKMVMHWTNVGKDNVNFLIGRHFLFTHFLQHPFNPLWLDRPLTFRHPGERWVTALHVKAPVAWVTKQHVILWKTDSSGKPHTARLQQALFSLSHWAQKSHVKFPNKHTIVLVPLYTPLNPTI